MIRPSARTAPLASALFACAALACAAWPRQVAHANALGSTTVQTGRIIVSRAGAQDSAPQDAFTQFAARCAPNVAPDTLAAIVNTESAGNPYAIGVVGGHLASQPRTYAEALETARTLQARGYNFSMGLGQVNLHNLARYGESFETVFDVCRNLRAGAAILTECWQRAAGQFDRPASALAAALSCYYSGDFSTGVKHGYVARVLANAGRPVALRGQTEGSTADPQPVPSITTTGARSAAPARKSAASLARTRAVVADDTADDGDDIGAYLASRAAPKAPTLRAVTIHDADEPRERERTVITEAAGADAP
uniref:lytic transglycosylase domain-containing protein n=1 Tax=Burkholderia arboris TaxID=488730 RepID=UPI003BEEF304